MLIIASILYAMLVSENIVTDLPVKCDHHAEIEGVPILPDDYPL
jgi:hypothetical protein